MLIRGPIGRRVFGATCCRVRRTFTVTVSIGGRVAASTSFRRALSAVPSAGQQESIAADGFIGEFMHPAGGSARRPAVLVLAGSEGGLPASLLDGLLASYGYAVLAVAYFGLPGQDRGPRCLPGSEAAQLLGVHYPSLVHAVIASVPSDASICSYPGCTGPAWTLGGKPLPYTKEVSSPTSRPGRRR